MSDHAHLDALPDIPALATPKLKGFASLLLAAGLIAFIGLIAAGDANRAWGGFLAGLVLPAWFSLAALFFIAVHRITGARWHAPVRRLMEGLSVGIPLTLVGFIVLAAAGASSVYDWFYLAGHDAAGHAALFKTASKAAWMTPGRWVATGVAIPLIWWFLQNRLVATSLAEDGGATIKGTHRAWSLAFLLLFAYTFTLFAWDLLLSLQVHAISAMWGIYQFVGALQALLALLLIIVHVARRTSLAQVIGKHTIHDIGTWLVGLSCVWAYITFAQYLIIAFANMDEETQFYLMRFQHGWKEVAIVEVLLRFPLPFFLLLSQSTRTTAPAGIAAGVAIVVAALIQLVWIVAPVMHPNGMPTFPILPELAIVAGFLGGYLLLALRFWRKHGLVARNDPDLLPSINAEHLH